MAVNIFDVRAFKTWNFRYVDNPIQLIIEAIAVLMGDYDINRKWAANIILKILLRDDFKRFLLEDASLYPTSRDDGRVRAWKKAIISKGQCEMCGSKERLEAHHIIHWADYPQGRFAANNGRCLCHDCHTNEHYGDQSYYMMKAK